MLLTCSSALAGKWGALSRRRLLKQLSSTRQAFCSQTAKHRRNPKLEAQGTLKLKVRELIECLAVADPEAVVLVSPQYADSTDGAELREVIVPDSP